MHCQRCGSERILSISIKCCDGFFANLKGKEYLGYAPDIRNIGKGDYIKPKICLDCGQLQGDFPVKPIKELEL